MPIDYSPEALAARIKAAGTARTHRAECLDAAQRIYSKYGINDDEVLRAVQNLQSAIRLPQDEWIKERLAELCCDIETAAREGEPEVPEAYSGRERGEYDSMTANVRGRA